MKKIATLFFVLSLMLTSFTAGAQNLRGDVNLDGNVSIGDVTTLIDYLLTGQWPGGEQTETFTVNGVTFTMVAVEGGTFTMGATAEQGSSAESDEKPTHQVTLSSYYIGQTEVTQALWVAVMGSNPSYVIYDESGELRRPVERVSWDECQAFIYKLSYLTGRKFRMPTEAEWEYAARGGKKSHGYKYAGSNNVDNVAHCFDNADISAPVAILSPNELGLYDMSGNVWEWCQDWYGSYSSAAQTNPIGPSYGSTRVIRGGSYMHEAVDCRVSNRGGFMPETPIAFIGLRLAL